MPVKTQYYYANFRLKESPLDYLYHLNDEEIREKLQIWQGLLDVRRAYVEHFIGTLDDRDLANELTLLGLEEWIEMAETLRVYQRMEFNGFKHPQDRINFDRNLR